MIKNYIKIAWRNLIRNRAFTAINIVGLALGLATCLLIGLFVINELSYDRYNEKADRIVRVVFKGTMNDEQMREANVMPPVAQTLKADYPEVLEATRLRSGGTPRITYGDKTFKEDAFAYVDSNFFQVFTLPLIKGDARTALVQPNTVVITSKVARKYFGDTDPMGKVLTFKESQATYTVTGVINKVPANSHFHKDIFASMASLPESREPNWLVSSYFTYLVLPEGYDYRLLEAKLPKVVETHLGAALEKMTGMSMADFQKQGNNLGLYLQPLTDIHLYSDLVPQSEMEPGGDIRYVYLFGAVALFMLLLACINFMNLSTAGASKRAKEVGIRKVMGSEKSRLVGQFLVESILLTGLSLVLGLGVATLVLPFFNDLSGKELNLDLLQTPSTLVGLILFGLLVGILAGSYPAFFLSSYKPISILKGGTTGRVASRGSIGLRSSLVVFQFCISIILIIGTTVVFRQLRYIQDTKLGYDKEQVVVLEGTWALGQNEEVLRQQLVRDSRVINASRSGFLPAGSDRSGILTVFPQGNEGKLTRLAYFGVDYQYVPTLGMKVVSGRNFSPSFPTDSAGVIINEAAAKHFGWQDNAIGQILTHPGMPGSPDRGKTYHVVGVVKDFHYRSLHEKIAPMVMALGDNSGSIIIKTKVQDMAGLVANLKEQWEAFRTEEPFQYSFLDETYWAAYEAEIRTGRILAIFAGLTIFVACLGLFGLVKFATEQRVKEIGVRKVLGASVASIVTLLSIDFLKLVLIALVIATPVAWYAMDLWLQDFAYKTSLSWWMVVVAVVVTVAIALLTISFQSIRAALVNPVKSLKSE
ncbi:ABC transporter permease [Telluribacter humicola]|uniref:ABC transporter permease n=1 Tax=Telluribacter humicola TaxID=1720261 RepID=UPI001A95FD46|nr:ABC transporter permease [Telluribacter humicola]